MANWLHRLLEITATFYHIIIGIVFCCAVCGFGYYWGKASSEKELLMSQGHEVSRILQLAEGWERQREQSEEIHFALVRYWNPEQDASSTLPYAHIIPVKVDAVSRDLQDLIKREYHGLYPNKKFKFSLKFRDRDLSADRTLHQLGALYFSKPAKILPGASQVFFSDMQQEEHSILCEVQEERNSGFGLWQSANQ